MIWLALSTINRNHAVRNVFHMILLHKMLHIWHIAKNGKSKLLGPQFHGNQDYLTIKVISRRTFVLVRLQLFLLMNVVMRKYLSSIYHFFIKGVVSNTSGLTQSNRGPITRKRKILNWHSSNTTQRLNSIHDWNCFKQTERKKSIINSHK